MMERWAAVTLAVSLVAACGSGSPDAERAWADRADEVVRLLADAYDATDPYQTARFFGAGGSLDLTAFGGGVATSPDGVVKMVQNLWHQQPGRAKVEAEHLFVSPDGAVVWWWAYDEGGGQDWVQSYFFGPEGRTASRAFRAIESGLADLGAADTWLVGLVDGYVDAWAARDPEAVREIYAADAVVLDAIAGREWRSVDELVATLGESPPLEPGPWPRVFVYKARSHVEAIVLVQVGGVCPMLEARWLVLDGESVVRELRFTHVPSARRCLAAAPDGWWTAFEVPPELVDNVTEVIDAGGSLVKLVHAEPSHADFARWLFGRYLAAGIGVPEIAAVWFPPVPECTSRGGLAIESDQRYEGRHTVVVCFAEDRVVRSDSPSGWSATAVAYGLHELAHVWMLDHLDDETRGAFDDMAGFAVWRGPEAPWHERGVEHAAFTIAWGIAGTADARYPMFPAPTCEELAERFRLLTGREPMTACGEDGWAQ